jgi:AcrR family transcriptional regulator
MESVKPLDGPKTRGRAAVCVVHGAPSAPHGAPGKPRERILAAMIEAVGEQGYSATTVADVIALAKASRRTFYEQFTDRQTCFLTAADRVDAVWNESAAAAVDDALAQGGDAVEAFVHALLGVALATPAAPRLLIAELAGAGADGVERRERVFADLAATLHRALQAASDTAVAGEPARASEDSLVLRAVAGAIVRVAYRLTLRGTGARRPRRAALFALVKPLAQWATAFRALPAPSPNAAAAAPQPGGRAPGSLALTPRGEAKRGLPRGESTLSRSFVVHSQRERLLDAVANLSATKGYDSVTIPDIVAEAAVSVQAFYAHFSGRDDALLVAYEIGHRKAFALAERARETQDGWAAGIGAAISTLLDFLASEPSFARLALVDAPAAGGKVAALAREGEDAIAELLEPGVSPGPSPAAAKLRALAAQASAGAVYELCYVHAAAGRTRELTALSGIASQLTLVPFAALAAH